MMSDTEVIIGGRTYRLVIHPVNCTSLRHWHSEPHADGSSGTEAHHHHDDSCSERPLQATLYPTWDPPERHNHDFGLDRGGTVCYCGATRVPHPERRGNAKLTPVEYKNQPDDAHPHGWSYVRPEEL